MTRRPLRLAALLLAPALVVPLAGSAGAAPAAPAAQAADRGPGTGPRDDDAAPLRDASAPAARGLARPLPAEQAKATSADAQTCPLSFYPQDPDDASLAIGVTPYADIAPRLCAAARSDRVTVEVAGTSVQGREMPLVTVTSPETPERAARNDELQALLTDDPQAAAALLDSGGYDDYKPTALLNMSIHGNEYEGVDNGLAVVEYLATAPADAPAVENTDGLSAEEVADLPTVGELLDSYRVVVLSVANPDGRVLGQRQNDASIDLNRDHVTQSQPEQLVMRDTILDALPVLFQDHHGYVNGDGDSTFYTGYGLLEPTSPPHGESYEYDLYIRQALPLALQAEADVERRRDAGDIPLMQDRAETTTSITIPFRDIPEGWDDWPPIFTPMYAMYHGAVGATVEVPFNPRNLLDDDEARAAAVANNIEYGRALLDTMLVYGVDNRDSLLADQLDVFRRGEVGAPSPMTQERMPDGFVDGWGDEDRYPTTYPRAYVIPVGDGQASDASAATLAQHLLDNRVEVRLLTAPATVDGTSYAAGSYVVDMHQARRGLAHVLLDEGTDVSDRVDAMYDISGWSLGLLWGATVADTDDAAFLAATQTVQEARPVGGVPAGPALGYGLRLTSPGEIAVLTGLWDADVTLQRAADGTVLVPGSARDVLADLVAEEDVAVTPLSSLPAERTVLPPLRIGAAIGDGRLGQSTYRLLTDELGLDVTQLSRDDVADLATDLDSYDVLLTAEGQLAWDAEAATAIFPRDFEAPRAAAADLGPAGRQALSAYLAGGGGLVSYGRLSALGLVEPSGVVDGLDATGSRDDANGVLTLAAAPDARALVEAHSPPASFGYPVAWFPGTGDAAVEQRLADDPLVSGHWLGDPEEVDQRGQDAAAGEALTVSAELAAGGRLVAFGSEPLFRWHPRGLFDEVVEAMLWAADLPVTTAARGEPSTGRTPQPAAAVRSTDDACPPGQVPPLRFPDVIAGATHADAIACMDWWEVVRGLPDGTYGPDQTVSRERMASFVARAVDAGGGTLPTDAPDAFSDDDGSFHEANIDALAAAGIVRGRGDGVFAPTDTVSRAQMASFLVRAYAYVSGEQLPVGGPYFDDLGGVGAEQATDIDRAAAVGITGGRTATGFDPRAGTRRDQMASFLARLVDLFVEDGSAAPPSR